MFLSYSVVKPHMVAGEKERWKKWQSKKSLSGAKSQRELHTERELPAKPTSFSRFTLRLICIYMYE